MLSGIWTKVSAVLAALSGILFFWAKMERKAKQEAQHEVKIKDTIDEIDEKQEEAKVEVLHNEQSRIKKRIKKNKSSSIG
jgi:ABC-type nickel/cobalt efflux system permease component RcnA